MVLIFDKQYEVAGVTPGLIRGRNDGGSRAPAIRLRFYPASGLWLPASGMQSPALRLPVLSNL